MTKKEEIILVTLDLASKYGLKSLSMSQIAEGVGIRKPSLYNHFDSKETLIKEMYQYIREKSKENINSAILNESFFNKSAPLIIRNRGTAILQNTANVIYIK